MNAEQTHPVEQLAFYVNGSLLEEEQREVEQHIAACEQCRDELAFLRALQKGVQQLEAEPVPVELGWQRLRRDIKAGSGGRHPPRQGWLKLALAASLLVVAVETGLLLQQQAQPDVYVPAGGGQSESLLQIRFHPQASAWQIQQVLTSVGAQIVSGPGTLGIYRIRLDGGNEETMATVLAQLRAQPQVIEYAAAQ